MHTPYHPSDICKASGSLRYYISHRDAGLLDMIPAIAEGRYSPLRTFCNQRNTVELISIENRLYVIKKFKRPTRANQVIYTFFRKNKARRCYEYALLLKNTGIGTPAPAAYMELRRYGIIHTVWYISEYTPLPTLQELYDAAGPQERESLCKAVVEFMATLHSKGIWQADNNSSNLLVEDIGDGYRFSMVDINRLRFGRQPGIYRSVVCIMQCRLSRMEKLNLVSLYARIRNYSAGLCELAAKKYLLRQRLRHILK